MSDPGIAPGLADLGGTASVLMADRGVALAGTMRVLLRPGDHLLASAWIAPATHQLLAAELAKVGATLTFVDPSAARSWQRLVQPTTRAIFVEDPVIATGHAIALPWLTTLARDRGLALIVDRTAAPAPHDPPPDGVDLVIADIAGPPGTPHGMLHGAAPLVQAACEVLGAFSGMGTAVIVGAAGTTRPPLPALE